MKKTLILLAFISCFNISNAQWQQTNMPHRGSITSIASDGVNIFAGDSNVNGGIFLSTNNGSSWTAVNNGLSNLSVEALAISGSNIFTGTWGGGIFLSTNNGNSWSPINNGLSNLSVEALAISGSNIFAGTYGRGVFLSTNNGSSWTPVNNGLENFNTQSLIINGSNIFAGEGFGISGGVFLSTNNGSSWTKANTGLASWNITSFAISGSNIFAGTLGGGYATSSGVCVTTNNGTSWTIVNNGLTNLNIHSLAVSGTNIFAGTENGVFVTTNNGSSWSPVNTGLANASITSLAIVGSNIFAGTATNGVWVRPLGEMISLPEINPINYPKITINTANINVGQNISLTGKYFTPNSTANVVVNGADGFSQTINNITTDGLGGFVYSLATNSTMPSGNYTIVAIDNISGFTAPIQRFKITPTLTQTNLLSITTPMQPLTVNTDEKFVIEWKDKMELGANYTIVGSKRKYKYTLELSNDNGSTWDPLTTMEGQAYNYSWAQLNFKTSIATAGSNYVIRIKDFYNSSNMQITPVITVNSLPVTGNLKIDLKWDLSYPQPAIPVIGVAAEGTARIFLNLAKIDPTTGQNITSVKVELSDGVNGTDPSLLGKVKVATETTTYSSEANGITTITAIDNVANKDNYKFWYVAPDDYADAKLANLNYEGRMVKATFTVTYSNGTTETIPQNIKIVRPPLMLVHGLGSDKSTWNNFRHTETGYETKFVDDNRYKTRIAVNIYPDALFLTNALKMTVGSTDTDINTFQGVINNMRQKGYAANRVDYIGHSMGGSVLRSIYDNYNNYFTRTGNASNRDFKNYERGYVNKVILIGTPNNGSPLADIINRYAGDLGTMTAITLQTWYGLNGDAKPLPLLFLQPENYNDLIPTYKASDAVKNLQLDNSQGGIYFGATNTKAHLIAGDIIPGKQYDTNGLIPQEIINIVKDSGDEALQYLLNKFLKIAIKKEVDPVLKKELSNILESKVPPVQMALDFFNKMAMVIDAFNTGTFLPESDLVVSVGSQLAGYPKPTVNGTSNVSQFDNYVGHAFFRAETKNIEIGNRVYDLLNQKINSPYFKSIPGSTANKNATKSYNPKGSKSLDSSGLITSFNDTSKLQIITPVDSATIFLDSTFHVQFSIKDTLNLKSVQLVFQNKIYEVDSIFKGNIDMNLQVNSNLLDKQSLVLEGFYDYTDSGVFVYDMKNVNIKTNDLLTGIEVDPKILYLFKNQFKGPEYQAIFQNSIAVGNFSPDITAIVDNPSIVTFNPVTKGFKGITAGETFATVSYNGFSDILYFVVDERDVNPTADQMDDDGDTVMNDKDLCPSTPSGELVDTNGCSPSQLDDDNDGVMNNLDLCPNTPTGETVDTNGCSSSQLDDDNDGVMNNVDLCPNTQTGEIVDVNGCSSSLLTYVPDNNFEQALIDLGYDKVLDDYVTTSNISGITYLNVMEKNIRNLTGIEDFKGLLTLYCNWNLLTELDISNNTALTFLNCNLNQLTTLDVSNNKALSFLSCQNNLLTSLDVDNNTFLNGLYCSGNLLTNLSVSNNTALTELYCNGNQLKSLDVSQNKYLLLLSCDYNQLNSLNVNNNTALIHLVCHNNFLTSLDVSNNKDLVELVCSNNRLSILNVKNGNNYNFLYFDSSNNPNLTCIEVDNVAWSAINWLNIDPQTSFSEICNIDNDTDGVMNNADTCPNTPSGETVDVNGCSQGQIDDDGDGIMNNVDLCPNTPIGESVNANGCATSQLDTDNDGIKDNLDTCPSTPTGESVNATGCSASQLDTDNDGVKDNLDTCPNTPIGEDVNATGCSQSQIDDDGDGVMNTIDTCPNTPAGETVNATGCSQSQIDDDGDGVMNDKDLCPNTTSGTNVNANGCFFLSTNNFSIEVIGETCPDKNNGKISISAQATHNYVATINGANHNFTNNNLSVSNLAPGSYNVCIKITGVTYEQCFTITIAEGKTVSGKSSVTSNKTSIDIAEGTAPFNIFINGINVLNTVSPSFMLEVKHGDLVEVKTAVLCEGVFSKTIDLFEAITVYPNPTNGLFEIALPLSLKEVKIELFTTSSQLISSKTYSVINGKVQLNIENMPAAVYFAKVHLENPVSVKIIKK